MPSVSSISRVLRAHGDPTEDSDGSGPETVEGLPPAHQPAAGGGSPDRPAAHKHSIDGILADKEVDVEDIDDGTCPTTLGSPSVLA